MKHPARTATSPDQGQLSRRRMIAAVQIEWKQLRPDLAFSPDELRDERLAFASNVLGLRYVPGSLTELTNRQLGRVLDTLRGLRSQPRLPNCEVPQRPIAAAAVVHLASAEQVHAINKLLAHLRWGEEAQRAFIHTRYRRDSPVHLLPRQASSLIRILLNIACQRELKERGVGRVTRQMIRAHIPHLKARLGIDRSPNTETEECQGKLI